MTFKTNLATSLLVLALLPLASLSAELQGRVVRIVDDGDTLVLLVEGADGQRAQEKVRLAGILPGGDGRLDQEGPLQADRR